MIMWKNWQQSVVNYSKLLPHVYIELVLVHSNTMPYVFETMFVREQCTTPKIHIRTTLSVCTRAWRALERTTAVWFGWSSLARRFVHFLHVPVHTNLLYMYIFVDLHRVIAWQHKKELANTVKRNYWENSSRILLGHKGTTHSSAPSTETYHNILKLCAILVHSDSVTYRPIGHICSFIGVGKLGR